MQHFRILGDMREKRIGRGEDSDPILFSNEVIAVIGVLDGMGGAGSTECKSDYDKDGHRMTKAYVASRIIRMAILEAISQNPEMIIQSDFEDKLKTTISQRYALEKEKYPLTTKISLRSSLIKDYPTTLAMVTVSKVESHFTINSYWAGDSRNYLWTQDGLYQISKDDLKGDIDPLENIREDAPVSNCLHADGAFIIHHKPISEIPLTKKFIVISATDGCFGYYPSPMDFERILQSTLQRACTIEEWKKKLISEIESVSGDDFSFGIALIGFNDFNEVKKQFCNTNENLYFKSRDNLDKVKIKFEQQKRRLEKKVEQNLNQAWADYKINYLKYIDNNE